MSTGYGNTGGSGDRTSLITVTSSFTSFSTSVPENLVNGSLSANAANSWAISASTAWSGNYIRFDFGSGFEGTVIIDEATMYKSNTTTYGVVKWQGSDDASTWTDIGSSFSFTSDELVMESLHGNTTGYRYYQLIGVSGSLSSTPWIEEFEFRISGLGANTATAKVSQLPLLALAQGPGEVRVSLGCLMVLQKISTESRVSQAVILALYRRIGKRVFTQIDTGNG